MNPLIPALAPVVNFLAEAGLPSAKTAIGIICGLAILALLIWGVIELVKATGWQIPRVVWIVLTVVGGIIIIYFIASAFGIAV